MSGWMEFEFDSVSSSKQVDKSSKSYSASMSFSAGGVGWGVSGQEDILVYSFMLY